MAAVTGNTADAAHYQDLATQIAAGFTKRYLDPATGVYGTGTQLSYALPLALGIVPAADRQTAVDRLVQDIAAHGDHVTTGFVGTTFVYQALGDNGRNDVALALAERTDAPSFGYMVANGPGTIWEKWPDSSAPDGTSSKDHIGLGGSVGQWYYQQLGGIQPGTTGAAYRTFTLAPGVVGDLTHVSAQQRTVRGTIVSSWQRDGATLTYHAVVPVGSTATVRLPLLGGADSTVSESGTVVFAGREEGRRRPRPHRRDRRRPGAHADRRVRRLHLHGHAAGRAVQRGVGLGGPARAGRGGRRRPTSARWWRGARRPRGPRWSAPTSPPGGRWPPLPPRCR